MATRNRAAIVVPLSAVVALGMLPILTSCDPFRGCTEAGCLDGLIVHVVGVPDSIFTIDATAPGFTPQRIDCHSASGDCFAPFQGFSPETATIRVSWESDTVEVTVSPQYETVRPNGSGCDPVCQTANVDITVP